MRNIFYDEREIGLMISNDEIKELRSKGNLSMTTKGKNLELKFFENEKKQNTLWLIPAGKSFYDVDSVKLYLNDKIASNLEREGILRTSYPGKTNEIVVYSENYPFFNTLSKYYNLER